MTPHQAKQVIEIFITNELSVKESGNGVENLTEALNLAIHSLDLLGRREERLASRPEYAGNPWTPEEDKKLISEFSSGLSIAAMSEKHKRTEGAITARLSRLGQLPYYGESSKQPEH
jgi:hypothetical protein